MQPTGGVDEHHVAFARPTGLNGVEDDRRGIGSLLRTHHLDTRPLRPDCQLVDSGGPKRVRRADQGLLPLRTEHAGELADGRRLPRAVHTDNQDDPGQRAVRRRHRDVGQNGVNLTGDLLPEGSLPVPPRLGWPTRHDRLR